MTNRIVTGHYLDHEVVYDGPSANTNFSSGNLFALDDDKVMFLSTIQRSDIPSTGERQITYARLYSTAGDALALLSSSGVAWYTTSYGVTNRTRMVKMTGSAVATCITRVPSSASPGVVNLDIFVYRVSGTSIIRDNYLNITSGSGITITATTDVSVFSSKVNGVDGLVALIDAGSGGFYIKSYTISGDALVSASGCIPLSTPLDQYVEGGSGSTIHTDLYSSANAGTLHNGNMFVPVKHKISTFDYRLRVVEVDLAVAASPVITLRTLSNDYTYTGSSVITCYPMSDDNRWYTIRIDSGTGQYGLYTYDTITDELEFNRLASNNKIMESTEEKMVFESAAFSIVSGHDYFPDGLYFKGRMENWKELSHPVGTSTIEDIHIDSTGYSHIYSIGLLHTKQISEDRILMWAYSTTSRVWMIYYTTLEYISLIIKALRVRQRDDTLAAVAPSSRITSRGASGQSRQEGIRIPRGNTYT